MGKQYNHLSSYEREQIASGLRAGLDSAEIGRNLGRPTSTITREINRNSKNRYDDAVAQKEADSRASAPRVVPKLDHDNLWNYVYDLLEKRWSPELISGRLKAEFMNDQTMHVSAETIYRYLYVMPKGELRSEVLSFLRQSHKKRRPRGRGKDRRGSITNMRLIADRPEEVESREVPGHWEGDLIKGKGNGSSIGTLVERNSRYVMLVKLKNAEARTCLIGFTKAFRRVPEHLRKTMTYDRGKEMAQHEKLTSRTGVKVYFADPHSPWQRGSNENMNGLIRDFFPKGMDLSELTQRDLTRVEKLLNSRARKIHGFFTPQEVYTSILTGKPVALGV
jgi:transposase, IS30 family